MRLIFALLVVLAAVCTAEAGIFKVADYTKFFKSFMTRFKRGYKADGAMTERFKIFQANVDKITLANAKSNAGYQINGFADKTYAEFRATLGLKVAPQVYERLAARSPAQSTKINSALALIEGSSAIDTELEAMSDEDLEKLSPGENLRRTFKLFFSQGTDENKKAMEILRAARARMVAEFEKTPFDWRTKNVLTPVKDQSSCGSCWAFGLTGAVESRIAISKKIPPPNLSEQHAIDCIRTNYGCKGGHYKNSFEAAKSGLYETSVYGKYSPSQKACAAEGKKPYEHSITDFIDMSSTYKNDVKEYDTDLMTALMHGPVAIGLRADPSMMFWGNKTMYPENVTDDKGNPFPKDYRGVPDVRIDHALVLVGHTKDADGQSVYIVRNSWGPNWGNGDGHFYLARIPGSNNAGIHTHTVISFI